MLIFNNFKNHSQKHLKKLPVPATISHLVDTTSTLHYIFISNLFQYYNIIDQINSGRF